MKHGVRKGSPRSALAIRLQNLPFTLPWKREAIVQKICSNQNKYGVNNQAINFKNGKNKVTIIFLDSFSESLKEKLLLSKSLYK